MRINTFQLHAPSTRLLASRLLTNPRSVSQPVVLKQRSVFDLFAPSSSHAVLATAQPWVLGPSHGFAGLGATPATGVGLELGMLGVGTAVHAWTMADFRGDANWLRAIGQKCGLDPRYEGGLTYTPPSPSLLSEADAKWRKMSVLRDTVQSIDTFMTATDIEIKSAFKAANDLVEVEQDALCGKRSNSVETQRIAAFNRVIAALQRIRAFVVPEYNPNAPPGSTPGSGSGQELDVMVAEQRRRAAAAAASSSAAATGESSPMKPLLIFGGLAAVGVGLFLWRKRG